MAQETADMADRPMTPTWAVKKLPEGVEVVRIKGRWWLLMWTEEHVVAKADPDQWLWTNGELGASQEMELWFPPYRHIAELAADLAEDAVVRDAIGEAEAEAE